jgi:hypothetical protein
VGAGACVECCQSSSNRKSGEIEQQSQAGCESSSFHKPGEIEQQSQAGRNRATIEQVVKLNDPVEENKEAA